MAQLTVRKLDPEIVRRLEMRAAEHNRSAEAEHRAILEAALAPGSLDFWERAAGLRADRRRDLPDEPRSSGLPADR